MFLKEFKAQNYRTLEDITVTFQNYYTAVSGRNNCGKSNMLRGIRNMLSSAMFFRMSSDDVFSVGEISYLKDFTNWKKQVDDKGPMCLKLTLELDRDADASVFKFISDLVLQNVGENETKSENNCENLVIELILKSESQSEYNIQFGEIAITKDLHKREILRRIKTSESVIFHNSTENDSFPPFRASRDSINSYLSEPDKQDIAGKIANVVKSVQKSLKKQQYEIDSLLGRLEETYEVSLSIEGLNLERESISISLKEKGGAVSLDEWGSGTQNRTLIFLTLLNARRFQTSSNESERLTPIVLIEEPESFLHPSAQAEFGRILQDLAEEFKIQVIVTTHSPYLLSHKTPSANILIERDLRPKQRESGSHVVNTELDWYQPFALALGINGEDFGPLKDSIFNNSSEVIFVEGETDKEYFELLRSTEHGDKRLNFSGEVYAYGGADVLSNNSLIKFIKSRHKKFLVTVDVDKFNEVKKSLEIVGVVEGVNLLQIGLDKPGKKNIEGLLPQKVVNRVFSENTELVQAAMENSKDKKSAQNSLKNKYLTTFKSEAKPGEDYYGEFYKVAKKLNGMLKALQNC